MKFEFEISEEELFEHDYWNAEDRPVDFREVLRDKVFQTLADDMKANVLGRDIEIKTREFADSVIKEKKDYIIERAIEVVADKIAKKKEIMELTPKASAIAAVNKENEDYFISLIDKAIAKRFK